MESIGNEITINSIMINLGNIVINSTEFWVIANLTSQEDQINLFSSINVIKNWSSMEIKTISTTWTPLTTGTILLTTIIGGFPLFIIQDDSPQNNYISRNLFIFNDLPLKENLENLTIISPNIFPINPFLLQFPGDVAALNLTIISPIEIDNIDLYLKKEFMNIINIDTYHFAHTALPQVVRGSPDGQPDLLVQCTS